MTRKKADAGEYDPYIKQRREEEKEKADELRREMIFLTRKAGRNPLSASYYFQMKELLEDLLMLELAQKAAEASMQYYTQNKIITINDTALKPFRVEMERAKVLKLITGVLSLSGAMNVEDIVDKVTTVMYGPKTSKPSKENDSLADIKKVVEDYAKKMEKLIMAKKA